MRWLSGAAMLLCALCVTLAAAPGGWAAPSPLPERVLLTSNVEQDKVPSMDSGLAAPMPCTGGGVALRPIWVQAARQFGLRWQILAAITKIESDFGCNMGPSSAGAIGWTQFIPDTWKRWGMDADGDGNADPRNAVDAIYSTARYLRVTGAPQNYRKAIFAYNHADWYVRDVLALAGQFNEFDEREFTALSEFARRGVTLHRTLEDLRASIAAVPDKRRALRTSLSRAQDKLIAGERQLKRRERAFARARDHLNEVTLHYISLTQGVAQGPQRPDDPEAAVLEYMAEARPEDAALVYQSASALMDQQAQLMGRMRQAAQHAGRAEAQVRDLVAQRAELVDQRREDLDELERLDDELRADLRAVKRRMREYAELERRYQRTYRQMGGGQTSLSDSPFVGSLEGLTAAERMVVLARAELERGVREQPMGSNDSPDIARYRSAVAGAPGPGPWCVYFVSYLAARAGAPLMDRGEGHGAVAALRAWGHRSGRWTDQPRPGYLIVFANHVGLVEKVSADGHVTTIEGNTSNRVARRFNRERSAEGYIRVGGPDTYTP